MKKDLKQGSHRLQTLRRLIPALLLSLICCMAANAQERPFAPAKSKSAASTIDAGSTTDLRVVANYGADMLRLLHEQNFDKLESTASQNRTEKLRFPGGVWKLYALYEGLSRPAGGLSSSDEEWTRHLSLLYAWSLTHPKSVTARIALAEASLNYAQKARDQIQQPDADVDQLKAFIDARVSVARVALKEATEIGTPCPHRFFVQQRSHGCGEELIDEAIALEPTYYPTFRHRAVCMHPRWGSDKDRSAAYADDLSARIGGKQGEVAYFEIAAALHCSPAAPGGVRFSWEKIQKGYAALEELYRTSLAKQNQYACLAAHYNDLKTARVLFQQIGDKWDERTWRLKSYFDSSRTTALAPPAIASALLAAYQNVATPEGKSYSKQFSTEFKRKHAITMRLCASPLGDKLGPSFDFLMKLGADGTVVDVKSWPETQFSMCGLPKILNTKFTPPPKGEYWVTFHTFLP